MRWLVLIALIVGVWWLCRHWRRVSRKVRRGLTSLGVPISVGAPVGGDQTPVGQDGGPEGGVGVGAAGAGCGGCG